MNHGEGVLTAVICRGNSPALLNGTMSRRDDSDDNSVIESRII